MAVLQQGMFLVNGFKMRKGIPSALKSNPVSRGSHFESLKYTKDEFVNNTCQVEHHPKTA